MVRVHLRGPFSWGRSSVAERLVYTQCVGSSTLSVPTMPSSANWLGDHVLSVGNAGSTPAGGTNLVALLRVLASFA